MLGQGCDSGETADVRSSDSICRTPVTLSTSYQESGMANVLASTAPGRTKLRLTEPRVGRQRFGGFRTRGRRGACALVHLGVANQGKSWLSSGLAWPSSPKIDHCRMRQPEFDHGGSLFTDFGPILTRLIRIRHTHRPSLASLRLIFGRIRQIVERWPLDLSQASLSLVQNLPILRCWPNPGGGGTAFSF